LNSPDRRPAAYPYTDNVLPWRPRFPYLRGDQATGKRSMSEPELLQDFNKQPLPVVSFRDQIAQLGAIAGILALAWLAWHYLHA